MADVVEVVHEDGRRTRMTQARFDAVAHDGWSIYTAPPPAADPSGTAEAKPTTRRRGARTKAVTAEPTPTAGPQPEPSEED